MYILQAKIVDGDIQSLWGSHCQYNHWLKETIIRLFSILKGTYPISKTNNPDTIGFAKRIVQYGIDNNKANGYTVLNILRNNTAPTSTINDETLVAAFPAITDDLIPLEFPTAGIAGISHVNCKLSYDALTQLRIWAGTKSVIDKKRKTKKRRLKELLRANPNFVNLTAIAQKWEEANGAIRGYSRYKWDKYFELLRSGVLGQYLGGETVKAALINSKELKDFDEFYQRHKRASRIGRPASYTLPHPTKHPIWITYTKSTPEICEDIVDNGDGTYNLRVKTLTHPINGGWITLKIRAGV